MSQVWLPGQVADQILADKQDRSDAVFAREFTKRLRGVDERLSCFRSRTTEDGLEYGFWYIVRRNDDGTTATWQVCDRQPDGTATYREPDERDIEALRALDLHNPKVVRAIKARNLQRQRQIEREKERLKEERVEDLVERWAFRTRTQIPFNHSRREKRAA